MAVLKGLKVYTLEGEGPVPAGGFLFVSYNGFRRNGSRDVIPHRGAIVRISIGVDCPDPDYDYDVEVLGDGFREVLILKTLRRGEVSAGSEVAVDVSGSDPLKVRLVRRGNSDRASTFSNILVNLEMDRALGQLGQTESPGLGWDDDPLSMDRTCAAGIAE